MGRLTAGPASRMTFRHPSTSLATDRSGVTREVCRLVKAASDRATGGLAGVVQGE